MADANPPPPKPPLVRLAPYLLAFVFVIVAVQAMITNKIPRGRGRGFRDSSTGEAILFGAIVLLLTAAVFILHRRRRR